MNINEIQSMWKDDSFVDPDNLHLESLKIPQLHSKYYEIFNNVLLLHLHFKLKIIFFFILMFYNSLAVSNKQN